MPRKCWAVRAGRTISRWHAAPSTNICVSPNAWLKKTRTCSARIHISTFSTHSLCSEKNRKVKPLCSAFTDQMGQPLSPQSGPTVIITNRRSAASSSNGSMKNIDSTGRREELMVILKHRLRRELGLLPASAMFQTHHFRQNSVCLVFSSFLVSLWLEFFPFTGFSLFPQFPHVKMSVFLR